MRDSYDLVIVGGGGSGLAAGVSAAQQGASALILEKCPFLGGTTGIAVGSFTASRTPHQQRAGVADSPDDHEEDAGRFGPPEYQARNNAPLRRYFLGRAAETLLWLEKLGLTFHGPSPEPPNRVPRMHNVVPNAKAYVAVLQGRFLALGGDVLCRAKAEELIHQEGRVTGVRVEAEGGRLEVRARRGVVLAAGDYANSALLIGQHKGREFTVVEGINPHSTGDGHLLAQQAGAELVNMDLAYGPEIRFVPPVRKPFSQLLPASGPAARLMGRLLPLVPEALIRSMVKRLLVTWQHPEDSLFHHGAVLVNARGRRFCNEKKTPEREIALAGQPDKIGYILLDERLAGLYSAWPHFISTAPEIAYGYLDDYRRIRPDITHLGQSLEEAARAGGLDPEAVAGTVAEFNRYARGQADDPFGRSGDGEPLKGKRWVLLGPAKAYFTTTEGGVRINQSCQALDQEGRPIPGLYAVGSNGLGGMVLWGHGLHIAWAITSGRLVGQVLGGRGGPGQV